MGIIWKKYGFLWHFPELQAPTLQAPAGAPGSAAVSQAVCISMLPLGHHPGHASHFPRSRSHACYMPRAVPDALSLFCHLVLEQLFEKEFLSLCFG